MRTHEIITGWLHLVAGLFVFGIVAVLWYLAAQIASLFAGTFIPELFTMFGIPIALILLTASGLEIAASVALIQPNPAAHGWARPALIALSALQLFIFPIGTAVSIYTFWALLFHKPEPAKTSTNVTR